MRETYQFAETVALPRTLTFFDFDLCLTFGNEERFFFFCSSRPILDFGLESFQPFSRLHEILANLLV